MRVINRKKSARHRLLVEQITRTPFLTDEEMAQELGVSVPTIRLDRLELGIPELRERMRSIAQEAQAQVKSLATNDVVGELLELERGVGGVSLMTITPDMVFEKHQWARGNEVFAQANSLALALADAPIALTGVANIKFKVPLRVGDKLIARGRVVRTRGNKYFIWVHTYRGVQEVFRGKFIVVAVEESPGG
jgi:Transcriptional regulators of sugar metabolism